MNRKTRIVTVSGSPHNTNSNTRALVEDFVEEMAAAGLDVEHKVYSLKEYNVKPCLGCWNCTKKKPCPLNGDGLEEIKKAMIECDMLILASPVYTNQVTAQMKAFFDRLFTWCHIFPLLGKYSLAAVTTGNDGIKPTADFMQKMLATYGTASFGTISSIGGFTPGFFPLRDKAREKNKKLAAKIAGTIKAGSYPATSAVQKRMFSVMFRKMSGSNTFRHMADAPDKSSVQPSPSKIKFLQKILIRIGLTEQHITKISSLMAFEYGWWVERNWLETKSFKHLATIPVPEGFSIRDNLLFKERQRKTSAC